MTRTPAARTTVSLFKNLAHHSLHMRAAGPVSTFWGACGIVRKEVFDAAGGFNEQRFDWPSIEDVELGWRLRARGARLRLDPTLQVKHLKQWTLGSLVATDVWRRAVPWTVLALERRQLPGELNLAGRQRVAAVLALAIWGLLPVVALRPSAAPWLMATVVAAAAANASLYGLFLHAGGLRLVVGGFALQQLYYLYSALGVGLGLVMYATRWIPWVGRSRLPDRFSPFRKLDRG